MKHYTMENVEELVRERLYNFYCELGWNCPTAETLAENIEVPEEVVISYWLDTLPDDGSTLAEGYIDEEGVEFPQGSFMEA